MFKNILLATDLSNNSNIVAARAKQMADMCGATLSVVYVLEYTPVVYGGEEFAITPNDDLMQTVETNAQNSLKQLGKDLSIPSERLHLITMDSVKHAVVKLAEKLNTDLIIVGSHGTHGPALLLGSVANAILHAAKCTVLAVRIQ